MSQQSDSSSAEEDISILDYARLSGIVRNHLAEPFDTFIEALQHDLPAGDEVASDSHLPQLKFPTIPTNERLVISREGFELLASITRREPLDEILLPMLDCRQVRKLRVEEPILRSDHGWDCREFARRDGFEIKLENVRLPQENIDEENGEGLSFPTYLSGKAADILDQLKHEKLTVPRETMVYLKDVITEAWTVEDAQEMSRSLLRYKKAKALEPVTPPLMPMSLSPVPYEPTSSELEIPLLSDPPSLTGQDLETLEKNIFAHEVPTPSRSIDPERESPGIISSVTMTAAEEINIGDIYSPFKLWDDPESSPLPGKKLAKIKDLKVDDTLTPPDPPLSKTVHFSNIIEEIIVDPPLMSSSPNSAILQDSFFQEAFGEAGVKATQMSEQEKLVAADATARVEVPVLDFSKSDPPWKKIECHRGSRTLEATQKEMIREYLGDNQREWPGVNKIRHQLRWQPFKPDLARVPLEEPYMPDESTWKVYIEELESDDVIDSFSLAWKQPRLKILKDEDDEDDEIEPGLYPKGTLDLSSLVKKRKMELVMRDEENGINLKDPWRERNEIGTKVKEFLSKKAAQNKELRVREQSHGSASTSHNQDLGSLQGYSLLGGPFSATNSLDNFLGLRGSKKQKLIDSSYFSSKAALARQKNPTPQLIPELPVRQSPVQRKADVVPLPAPELNPRNEKTTIIISSTLLKHRTLIRQVETLFPSLVFIERDFAKHDTTTWLRGSVSRSPVTSPLSREADLNPSPSTGIILTTIQKIKQKPLPGEKSKPAVRERIEKVSLRYERIIVLISEGLPDTQIEASPPLTRNEALALSELTAFTSGLPSLITVHYVAGGATSLGRWLTSSILNHSIPDPVTGTPLLEEETQWELFLRRAGMNAFAAQAVSSELKPPEGVDEASPSKMGIFGLSAFVDMAVAERVRRFEGLLGGEMVLNRFSAMIDQRWE